MSLEPVNSDIQALVGSSSGDLERVLERLRRIKSARRRLPFQGTCKAYEGYLSKLEKFLKDNLEAVSDLAGAEGPRLVKAVRTFRVLLTLSKNPPINEVIDLNLLPRLVQCLDSEDGELQFEAAWSLTNMAVGTSVQTRYLVEAGAVPGLVRLLTGKDERLRVQAVWALGNIAADKEFFRDHVVESGAVDGVVRVMYNVATKTVRAKCSWAIENMSSTIRNPEKFIQVVPAVRDLLLGQNEELNIAGLKVLIKLSNDPCLVKEIIQSGLLSDIEGLLRDNTVTFALQIIANITLNPSSTQVILDRNFLKYFSSLINTDNVNATTCIAEIMSNMSNGSIEHMQTVLDSEIPFLLWEQAKNIEDEKLRHHVISIISNIFDKGSNSQKEYVIERGVLQDLSFILKGTQNNIFHEALCCLEKILVLGEKESKQTLKTNRMAIEFDKCGGIEALESLISHKSEEIYTKAYELMERFFNEEDEPSHTSLKEMYEKSVFSTV